MPSPTDFPAKGRVLRVEGDVVVFCPANTKYEMHLRPVGGSYSGPVNQPVSLLIRAVGRKLLTVPSGGNFVAPIFGPPKTIQGRVKFVDATHAVIHAGVTVIVALPGEDSSIDLNNGSITVGQMLNAIVLAGATCELVPTLAAV